MSGDHNMHCSGNQPDLVIGDEIAEIERLEKQLAECKGERDELVAWQQSAFDAHPNIDMDIEYAIAKVGADKKGEGS